MPQDTKTLAELSPREQQIADAYSSGASYREIAEQLGVAPTTVRTHLGTIYRKLGVSTKIELLNTLSPKPVASLPNIAPPIETPAPGPVILVLPFIELTQQAEDHFCSGLGEDVLSRLGCLRGTRVISGTRLNQDSTAQTTAQTLGEALGASHILEGSARTYSGLVVRRDVRRAR